MKGQKIRHLLGIPKAPNTRSPKNRDVYLFDKSSYITVGLRNLTLSERRVAKLSYN